VSFMMSFLQDGRAMLRMASTSMGLALMPGVRP
jgi:hypothetical protein